MSELPFHLYVRTDTGRMREQNEDSVGQLALEDGQLVVVADGMGGHQAGDVASQITVRQVLSHVAATVGEDPRERLYIAIEKAHTAVRAHAQEAGTLDMGCTVVATFVQDGVAHVAHVGDSRLYLLREGRIAWVTRDHTRIRFLVDAGLLSEADAEDHPEGNVITRAVGHDPADQDGGFVVDVRNMPIELMAGDSLLLCSDGLYDMVGDGEILSIVGGRNARSGVELLVDRANEADRFGNEPGGYDNITVALMHFGSDIGAVPSFLDEDTLEPRTDPEFSLTPGTDPSIHAAAPPPAYHPQRSTLVPEPTLEDATVTLPDEGLGAAEPGVGTGTAELNISRLPPLASGKPTATVEVDRLRRANLALLLVVGLLVLALVLIAGWFLGQRGASPSASGSPPAEVPATSAPSGGEAPPEAPIVLDGDGSGADLLDDDDSAAPVGHADDDDSAAPPKASGQSE